jgi:hypothetical protein
LRQGARRGTPGDASEDASPSGARASRSAPGRIAAHEARFGSGEFGGLTFATWAELKQHSVVRREHGSDWRTVFNMLRAMENDYRFHASKIRLTVWYVW